MLTITLYKNVPLQRDNKNVILFNSANEVLTYLAPFYDGAINNVQRFFSNETFIDLTTLYEGCNYMCINDDRSNKSLKFFFIDNYYFVSGSTIRYEITMDIWNTYSYDIEFKKSHLICGHIDALTEIEDAINVKRSLRMNKTGDCTVSMAQSLIKSFKTYQNATLLAIISYSKITTMLCVRLQQTKDLHSAINQLQENRYTDFSGNEHTFQIQKVYVLNDFNLLAHLDSNYDYLTVSVGSPVTYTFQWYELIFANASNTSIPYNYEIKHGYLLSTLGFTVKQNNLYKDYFIGTKTTNEVLKIDSESRCYASITLTILEKSQLCIYLETDNIKINLTNDFEIPFINDNYTLYMAQNQATIEASNRSSASQLGLSTAMSLLSLGLSGATGGTSLLMGASMITNASNYMMKQDALNARLEDAQKQISRTDALYSGGIKTLLDGVGLWEITYEHIEDVESDYNLNGSLFNIDVDTFVTPRNDLNFYYLQFSNVNLSGEFSYNVKTKFEEIFTNGVRIWCDKTNYLMITNYK